ncbi:Transmembrane protein [Thalictrum thalictroides]|uniref:Transmembrane protein n=1 Tax=Thalictrum thalictroides TaxID=46969 RepID=A0A7J6W9F8_THATH|nr:Transmembrane protein [Thalictrum thalictroides]
MDDYDVVALICIIAVYMVTSTTTSLLYIDKEPSKNRDNERKQILKRMYCENDRVCHHLLRMNIISFRRLCTKLKEKGLTRSRWVGVKEQVALFLLILGHDTRMRLDGFTVIRSSETIHRHFHNVLRAVLKLGREYIKQVCASDSPSKSGNPEPWAMRYFKNCVGAIDDPDDVGNEWSNIRLAEEEDEDNTQTENVGALRSSNEWTAFRNNLTNTMWDEYPYR